MENIAKIKQNRKKHRLLRTGAPTEDICGIDLVCTIYCFIAGYDFQVELFFSTKIRDVLCGFVFRLRVHIGCNLEKYSALPAFFFLLKSQSDECALFVSTKNALILCICTGRN